MSVTLIKTKFIDLIILKKKKGKEKKNIKLSKLHAWLLWVLTAPPDPLRDLGTRQPSWPSLRLPIGAVTTHSALFVSPQTTQDLENKQWGQCHRYIMMSLSLASHPKARGQTQRDARKGFISLNNNNNNLTNIERAKLERSSIIYLPKSPFSPALLLD